MAGIAKHPAPRDGADASTGSDAPGSIRSTGKRLALGTISLWLATSCGGEAGGPPAAVTPDPAAASTAKGYYTVGGKVEGLLAEPVVLRLNGKSDLSIGADGHFRFAVGLLEGSKFEVTVSQHPKPGGRECSVQGGSGKVAGSDVSTVQVTCVMQKRPRWFAQLLRGCGIGGFRISRRAKRSDRCESSEP